MRFLYIHCSIFSDQVHLDGPEGLEGDTSSTSGTLKWQESAWTSIESYTLGLGMVASATMFTKTLRSGNIFKALDPDRIYDAKLTNYDDVGSSLPYLIENKTGG